MRTRACVAAAALMFGMTGIACSGGSTDPADGDGGGGQDSGAHLPDASVTRDGATAQADGASDDAHGGEDASGSDGGSAHPDGSAGDAGADTSTALDASDASVPFDASDAAAPVDASDASVTIDAATKDAATLDDGATDAGVCAPEDESTFTPRWHGPAPHASACSQPQIDAYHQCLKDGQTQMNPATCIPFSGSNASAADKACVQCILSQDTAVTYGPIIVHKGTIEMNVPGCIALAQNDPNGAGCAGKAQAADQCRQEACLSSCRVTDNASFQQEQACESQAASGTCASFENAAGCLNALPDAGGAVAKCVNGQNFDDLYDAIVPVFCGP